MGRSSPLAARSWSPGTASGAPVARWPTTSAPCCPRSVWRELGPAGRRAGHRRRLARSRRRPERRAAGPAGVGHPRRRRPLVDPGAPPVAHAGRECPLELGPLRVREGHAIVGAVEWLQRALADVVGEWAAGGDARVAVVTKGVAACRR